MPYRIQENIVKANADAPDMEEAQEISDAEATQALQGIYQKAQNGDQTSMKQFQEIQQAAQQLLQNQQAQKALHGAKLQYIRRLSGKCNERPYSTDQKGTGTTG